MEDFAELFRVLWLIKDYFSGCRAFGLVHRCLVGTETYGFQRNIFPVNETFLKP